MAPIPYDYGSSVVYQDNSVYVNGQNAGSPEEYSQQAQTLASANAYRITREKVAVITAYLQESLSGIRLVRA